VDLARQERQLTQVRDQSTDLGVRYRTEKRLQQVREQILVERERRG